MPLGELHPQHLPLDWRQRAEHLARGDAHDVRRFRGAFGQLLAGHDASLLAEVIAAGMTDRAEEPGACVADRFARREETEEHVMDESFGIVGRDAELLHRVPLKSASQREVPLFGRHCCTESHETASILTRHGTRCAV
jgi:hypothetical protein